MVDSRKRKEQLKAEEEIERKRKAKEANMKCNQKRKSGEKLRAKKSNKIRHRWVPRVWRSISVPRQAQH